MHHENTTVSISNQDQQKTSETMSSEDVKKTITWKEDVSIDMWLGQHSSRKYNHMHFKPRSVKKKCDTMSSSNKFYYFNKYLAYKKENTKTHHATLHVQQVLKQLITQRTKNYIQSVKKTISWIDSFDTWLGQHASQKYNHVRFKPRSVKKCVTMSSENDKTITWKEDISFDMWLGQYASWKYNHVYVNPIPVKMSGIMWLYIKWTSLMCILCSI